MFGPMGAGAHCPSFWRGPSLRQLFWALAEHRVGRLPLLLEGPFIEA